MSVDLGFASKCTPVSIECLGWNGDLWFCRVLARVHVDVVNLRCALSPVAFQRPVLFMRPRQNWLGAIPGDRRI